MMASIDLLPIPMNWRVRFCGWWLIVSNRMAARAAIDGGYEVRLVDEHTELVSYAR